MFRLGYKLIKNINKIDTRNLSDVYKYTRILDVYSNSGKDEKIMIKGWVKALRKQKEHIFIDVNDGTCSKHLQILISSSEKPHNLATGASLFACGYLNTTPKGQLELIANNVNITGECVVMDGYPFAPRKQYTPEYIRQYLHFRPRTNKFSSLLRLRHTATKAVHDYFNSNGYCNIHTPILTSNDCEGAGEVFTVQPENKSVLKDMLKKNVSEDEAYFNSKVFLTVSGQLHLEAAVYGLGKVYTFGPTFRAENSKSRLHLSEFYMIEAEEAFINKIEDIMQTTEKLLKNVTETIINKHSNDIERIKDLSNLDFKWLTKPFIILTYDEALNILDNNKKNLSANVNKEEGLSKEHELFLVKHCGDSLVFVINWPKEIKSFYMKQYSNDPSKVAAFDLLAPNVGEIVGGSLREDNYDLLKSKLPVGKTELEWYLILRKFGGVPTAGFGMGFERYLQLISGISNIKDTIPFPRWPHNCSL